METTDFALFSSLFEDLANEFQESTYGGANSALQSEPQQGQHVLWPLEVATSLPQAPVNAPIPHFTAPQSLPGSTAALPWGLLPPGIQPPPLTNLPTFPFGVPSLPAGLFSASQGTSVPITEGKAASGRRKRGPSVQDQVAELTATLHLQETIARNLARNNIWLLERNNIMEKVIKAIDNQTVRLRAMRDGLKFDPMIGLNTTYEAILAADPNQIATLVIAVISTSAMKMVALEPLLHTNPHLITETRLPPPYKYGVGGEPLTLHDPVAPILPPLKDTQYQHLLPDLEQLVVDTVKQGAAWSFMYLTKPEILQASNVSYQAMQKSNASWEQLHSDARNTRDIAETDPSIGTEAMWQKVATSLRLSDQQRLRMAVLWDIIDRGRNAVLRQRAQLADSLAQLNQVTSSAHTEPLYPSRSGSGTISSTDPNVNHMEPSQASQAHFLQFQDVLAQADVPDASGLLNGLNDSSAHQLLDAYAVGSGPLGRDGPQAQAVGGYGMEPAGTGGTGSSTQEMDAKAGVPYRGVEVMQKEMQVVQRLQHTVMKERCLILLGAEVMFTQILTPVQLVMTKVSGYPYHVDAMAVLHAGAMEFQSIVLERLVAAAHPDLASK